MRLKLGSYPLNMGSYFHVKVYLSSILPLILVHNNNQARTLHLRIIISFLNF